VIRRPLSPKRLTTRAMPPSVESYPMVGERRSGEERRLSERGLLHDISDSAAAIRALSKTLILEKEISKATSHRLEAILVEAERLAALCNRRSCDNRTAYLNGIVCDLEEICKHFILSRRSFYQTKIEYEEIECSEQGVWVLMESISVWRVLTNLVGNAARAAGRSGVIRLSIDRIPQIGRVLLYVDDTGPGLGVGPPGREGIGLRVVNNLLRSNGGNLRLRSGPLGGVRAIAEFATPD